MLSLFRKAVAMRFNELYPALRLSAKGRHFFVSAVFAGLAPTGFAADYSGSVTVSGDASHNDNLRMTENNKQAVNKYLLTPMFRLGADTETSTLLLTSILYFNRYDKSQFNSNDQNIGVAYTKKFENSAAGFNANVVRDSTITSETLTTGRVSESAQRTDRYQAAPYFSYTLNETNMLQLSGNYTTQNYQADGYTGYKSGSGQLDWSYIFNERLKFISTALYSDYESDDSQKYDVPISELPVPLQIGIDPVTNQPILVQRTLPAGALGQQSSATRVKEKRLQIGVDYQLSEASLVQARLGRSHTDTIHELNDPQSICGSALQAELIQIGLQLGSGRYIAAANGLCDQPDSDSVQSTAELDWTWSNERQQFNLSATKANTPTANGYVVDAIQVDSFWNFKVTEADQIFAHLALVRNRTIDETTSAQNASVGNRDYVSATLGYNHQISQYWFINTSYQFSQQKYPDLDSQASSKVISLGIRYQPQEWHWSR